MKTINKKLIKDILKVYLLRRKVPINVMFYLTNRCNLKCAYCQIPEQDSKNEIDTKTLIKSIKELDKLGCIRIGLIGGEPLLRSDFGQIIDACNKNSILADIYTNGYLVSKKINDLRKANSIIISLDGPANIHDTQRGKGSHDKAIKAIESCIKNNIPVKTITVLTKNNLNVVKYMKDISKKYGFTAAFHICSDTPISHQKSLKEIPEQVDMKNTMKKILGIKKNYDGFFNSKTGLKKLIKNKRKNKEHYPMGLFKCWFGITSFAINDKGDFYNCIHLENKEEVLNLKNTSVEKALKTLNIPKCRNCEIHCGMEYNLIFSLYPEAIFNFFKYFIAEGKAKKKN